MRTILFTGGRDYANRARVRAVLEDLQPELVIHGAGRGADTLVDEVARELGFPVAAFPADWERYGRAAGPKRNREMLDQEPVLVVAFPGGRGTTGTVSEAVRRGIRVLRVR
jgi:hypothetical protein